MVLDRRSSSPEIFNGVQNSRRTNPSAQIGLYANGTVAA
jgi:hypothetical protein